jgi:hypothetical protein
MEMEDWQRAPDLYRVAQDVLGREGLDDWLREQLQMHPQLSELFRSDVWRKIDGGPIVDRLCELCTTPSRALDAAMPSGNDLMNSEQGQLLLFNKLIQALPVDRLPEVLQERRLALDLVL